MQNKGVDPNSHKLIFKSAGGASTNTPSPSRTPEEKTLLFEISE